MTSSLTCSARTTRATAGCSATAPCRRARSARHVWRSPTVLSARSRSSRRRDMAADDRFTEDYRGRREDGPVGTRNEIITGPVSDWAADFSHLEPAWAADPYPIQDAPRQLCPIAHTERFGGGWLPTSYEDVAAIAYDTDHFSSRAIIMSNFRPPLELAPVGGSPPISSDPPFHHDARKLLLRAFVLKAVGKLEPASRAFCHSLIDSFGDRVDVDAATEYAQH